MCSQFNISFAVPCTRVRPVACVVYVAMNACDVASCSNCDVNNKFVMMYSRAQSRPCAPRTQNKIENRWAGQYNSCRLSRVRQIATQLDCFITYLLSLGGKGFTSMLWTYIPNTFHVIWGVFRTYRNRDSSVGIATGYVLDGPEIEYRWGRYFPHLSRPALGPT
jgi:hypothetical protein